MSKEKMFIGLNKKGWEEAIAGQNEHLQEKYGYEIATGEIIEKKHIKFLQQDMSIDANGFAKYIKTCPFYQGRFCF